MDQNKYPISCLPVSLYGEFTEKTIDLEAWSAFAKEAGADAIDMNINFLPPMDEAAAKRTASTLALPLMMIVTYADFSHPDEEARKAIVEQAKEQIRIAGALGAKYMRLTAGQHYPDCDEKETAKIITACYAACIPTAEAAGIRLLLENHSKPGAWRYDDFVFHYERLCLLWEEIKSLPIGVNFDTANACAVGPWREMLEMFKGRIETIHLNDLAWVRPLKFALIGEGSVPLAEMLEAIFATGFEGPVCIEEAGMLGREGVARAIGNTRALLKRGPL